MPGNRKFSSASRLNNADGSIWEEGTVGSVKAEGGAGRDPLADLAPLNAQNEITFRTGIKSTQVARKSRHSVQETSLSDRGVCQRSYGPPESGTESRALPDKHVHKLINTNHECVVVQEKIFGHKVALSLAHEGVIFMWVVCLYA